MFPFRLLLVYSYLQPVVAHFHYQHAAFALGVERRDTVGRSLGRGEQQAVGGVERNRFAVCKSACGYRLPVGGEHYAAFAGNYFGHAHARSRTGFDEVQHSLGHIAVRAAVGRGVHANVVCSREFYRAALRVSVRPEIFAGNGVVVFSPVGFAGEHKFAVGVAYHRCGALRRFFGCVAAFADLLNVLEITPWFCSLIHIHRPGRNV